MSLDWSTIYKKYKGQWVAFEEDEETVVAVGMTAREALDEAKKRGKENPILARIPTELLGFIGVCSYEVHVQKIRT